MNDIEIMGEVYHFRTDLCLGYCFSTNTMNCDECPKNPIKNLMTIPGTIQNDEIEK